jgi:D-xylose transport system permease protein
MSRTDAPLDEPGAAVPLPADLGDERLIQGGGVAGALSSTWNRIKGGDLGSIPVIVGLVIIAVVFYAQDPVFLSSRSISNILQFAAPVGIIALGVVLVLLVGEIDLSVGSVSGLAAAVLAWLVVYQGQPLVVGMLAGAATGAVIGISYGLLYTKIGVPSFVITLAGLLGFLGLQLAVLGKNGTVNLPRQSGLIEFARTSYLSGIASYLLVVVVVLGYAAVQLLRIRRRTAAGLSAPSPLGVAIKAALFAAAGLYAAYYLGIYKGFGYLFLLFFALVVLMDLLLRRTTWGRHVFAVGGNEEAARRAGIRVNLIYVSVFTLTGLFAAVGGILASGQLTSVSQASGGTDTNLTAIAAAVIGGTSLFGGRGSAYAALLGIIVLQSIQTGLNVIGVESEVRYMVTGAVLLLAVSIDSVSRRARSSSGRG